MFFFLFILKYSLSKTHFRLNQLPVFNILKSILNILNFENPTQLSPQVMKLGKSEPQFFFVIFITICFHSMVWPCESGYYGVLEYRQGERRLHVFYSHLLFDFVENPFFLYIWIIGSWKILTLLYSILGPFNISIPQEHAPTKFPRVQTSKISPSTFFSSRSASTEFKLFG